MKIKTQTLIDAFKLWNEDVKEGKLTFIDDKDLHVSQGILFKKYLKAVKSEKKTE